MTDVRALVLTLLMIGGPAFAQSSDAKKQAKAAFDRAVAAEHKKDWATAIDEFQAAYEILPHADVLYNIAVDYERLEEFRDAATYYRRYLDDKTDATDREKVEALIEKLRARPGKVTVATEPAGAKLAIDGKQVGTTPWSGELSGEHHLSISGPGGTHEEDIEIEYGEPKDVDIEIAAKTGVLTVTSNVADAQVVIDGQNAGGVPLQIALASGTHRVVVTAQGWASYERPVDIPPEGSSQVVANLVRPLGYVEPVAPTRTRLYFISFSGGADASGTSGGIGELMFGIELGRAAGSLGYGYTDHTTTFDLEARVELTKGKVRPYVRGTAMFGAAQTYVGAGGVIYRFPSNGRSTIGAFVDVGVGYVRGKADFDGTRDTGLVIPVQGGVQISY